MFYNVTGKISCCGKTDRGLYRNINQDAIATYVHGSLGLFVLSDGMGGHSSGEVASREIVLAFNRFWEKVISAESLPDFMTMTYMVRQIIQEVNRDIYERYNKGQVCGATVVVLLVVKDCYAIFSVGDSRIYTCRKRQFLTVTVDDIWDNLLETINRYTKEEIARHRNAGKLVQAVGIKPEININVKTDRVKKGQTYLLCSDGLFKYCEEEVIRKELQELKSENRMNKSLEKLIQRVYSHGAGDNVSIILVRVV